MRRILSPGLLLLASLALILPNVGANGGYTETTHYTGSAYVVTPATGQNGGQTGCCLSAPVVLNAPVAGTTVTIHLSDDVTPHVAFSACLGASGQSTCAVQHAGDVAASRAVDTVTLVAPQGFPLGTVLDIQVYTAYVGNDASVAASTAGTITATWS